MSRPPAEAPSTAFAAALLGEWVRLGVRDVVVAPGSRSQALALVAAELERAGLVRLRVRIDERVAAFLALGIAAESGRPAVVITTSGTAVANLHPAVLEAHHSGVPMLVVTADRPDELRGIGSNQTTVQPGLFADAVGRTWDVGAPTGEPGEGETARSIARAALVAAERGPVHVNIAFTEPLSSPWSPPTALASIDPDDDDAVLPYRRGRGGEVVELEPGPRTIVVAGTGAGPRAEELARALGAPLFAEVSSGARFGPNLVVPYREVIRDEGFLGLVERVVVLGHPTLSREVPWLIERATADTIVVRGVEAEAYNPGHAVRAFVDDVVVVGEPPTRAALDAWLRPLVQRSRRMLEASSEDVAPRIDAPAGQKARAELAAVRAPVTRRALAEAVWRASWPHDRLVVAASRLIRDLDRTVPGKRIPVHANRGLAGIDGTIATATGIALASRAVTRVLVGDLAFLHDVGALALGEHEERPRLLVIVGDDGGGTIFGQLEVAEHAGAVFDRVMLTPQRVDVEAIARGYGWEYRRVATRGELDPALSAVSGPTVVHVSLPR